MLRGKSERLAGKLDAEVGAGWGSRKCRAEGVGDVSEEIQTGYGGVAGDEFVGSGWGGELFAVEVGEVAEGLGGDGPVAGVRLGGGDDCKGKLGKGGGGVGECVIKEGGGGEGK